MEKSEGTNNFVEFDVGLCTIGAKFGFVGSWWTTSVRSSTTNLKWSFTKASLAFALGLKAIKRRGGGKKDLEQKNS